MPTKGVPAWCGLALQANLLHVMLEGKLNMESILILLLKRRPAYSLQKLIFGEQEAAVDKLEQSFKCLSDHGVSCALQIQQIDVISTLVSGKIAECYQLVLGKAVHFRCWFASNKLWRVKLWVQLCLLQSICDYRGDFFKAISWL